MSSSSLFSPPNFDSLPASPLLPLLYLCHSLSHSPFFLSPLVLWPLAGPPYHLLLNECAASSFANNQCRQNTKERTKLLYSSAESFWMRQLLERRLEPGQDVKQQQEKERVGWVGECQLHRAMKGERGSEKLRERRGG